MNKTLVILTACFVLLGAVAVAPTATADHGDHLPQDNPTCIDARPEPICLISDDGWCWLFHHCPL